MNAYNVPVPVLNTGATVARKTGKFFALMHWTLTDQDLGQLGADLAELRQQEGSRS